MNSLIDISNLNSIKEKTITLICKYCNIEFCKEKKKVKFALKSKNKKCIYCSLECYNKSRIKTIQCFCINCSKEIIVTSVSRKRSKNGNNFCSRSCAATYNNTHKTKGNRRSKLENWLESKLILLYPMLDIKFNDKKIINSELDIYIPSLNIAFELNGIFHYEPIYGSDKLSDIKNNDSRKFQACLEQGIELVIIDTSSQKYFKDTTSVKYLDIITNIINSKML